MELSSTELQLLDSQSRLSKSTLLCLQFSAIHQCAATSMRATYWHNLGVERVWQARWNDGEARPEWDTPQPDRGITDWMSESLHAIYNH